jgi:hypothetical protein
MEMMDSPKRQLKLVLRGTKSQKTSSFGTAMKATQKTVLFQYELYLSMERQSTSISTVIQLWKPISLRNPEDGDDRFSET